MKNQLWEIVLVSLLGSFAAIPTARAEDKYYMLILASQTEPNLPRLCHTFGVFVKAPAEAKPSKEVKIETHCISWMPQSLVIEPLRVRPVPGANLDLAASLKWARSVDLASTVWGPFVVKKELYDMAVLQETRLNSGAVEYIMLDNRLRGEGATNCIHALSDLDTTQEPLATGVAHGNEASEMVLAHFERYIIPTKESHRWLCDRLDLKPDGIRFATPDPTAENKPVVTTQPKPGILMNVLPPVGLSQSK